ncbi:hypothetical protein Pa4123_13350 [Phytohabitans aurantiacus]|uniref:Ig-like domain repeat protein n=2 Tax=Phytohabitans aurantiacus TaxID=3016789 RepID=A0ABQ5QP99_9ACTN|nr:hypothetical protein Pa4123_13350 [Phytohabitans aurantiacus]
MEMTTTRPRTRRVLAASTISALLATLLVAATGPAAYADGSPVPGNKNCSDLISGAKELRIDPPSDGTFTDGTLSVTLDVRTLTSDDPSHSGTQTGSPVFDYTATGGATVIGVAVKGGPNTNFYDYRPGGANSGTALHAPVNPANDKFFGLSHVSFCYVPKVQPAIVTQVSAASITIGDPVHDTATLSGGNNPTGTITFQAFGPDDATCSGTAAFTSTVPVNGNGDYDSAAFTPNAVGTYEWIASYSGDAFNFAATTACGDVNESVVVNKARPTMNTVPDLLPNDSATIAGAFAPAGGTISFKLYLNADCTGDAAYVEPDQTVDANGTYVTSNTTFKVTADATISWVVEYSGDANNEAASSGCTQEQVVMDFTPLNS